MFLYLIVRRIKSLTKNNQNTFKFSKKILHFYESMKTKLTVIIQSVESQPVRNADKYPFVRTLTRRENRSNTITAPLFHSSASSIPTSAISLSSPSPLPPFANNIQNIPSGPVLFERKPGSASNFDENHPAWNTFKILQILMDIYHPSSGIKRSSVSINKQSVQLFSGLIFFSKFKFIIFTGDIFPWNFIFLIYYSIRIILFFCSFLCLSKQF